jgi:hypothetical protein
MRPYLKQNKKNLEKRQRWGVGRGMAQTPYHQKKGGEGSEVNVIDVYK